MKKITLLLIILFSSAVYCQDTDMKIYIEKTEPVSIEQYDFIKKVNQFYPDILVSKQVTNNIVNNLKVQEILSTDFLYETPKDYDAYRVSISKSNTSLDYFYKLKDGTFVSGDIRLFAGSVVRTVYKLKGNFKTIQYYVDGKLLNEIK
ncbi:hypothetical protein ASE40_15125 [Flavobacterium sp. Root935]|uniref:hypothetical protein n=1 Tax=Flavobacterium sp. Root935 TaxID=1736610 RepID=UPI00070DEC07|nr:hypothetical protein [Flavobacterium sp. Root935]KRD57694.1 hypothetical protein ASE40_15125 [Flavobacterium sp. Root935]